MSKIEKLMVDDTHHADFVDEDYQYEEYKKSNLKAITKTSKNEKSDIWCCFVYSRPIDDMVSNQWSIHLAVV